MCFDRVWRGYLDESGATLEHAVLYPGASVLLQGENTDILKLVRRLQLGVGK